MKIYENYIDKLRANSKINSETRFVANQLLEMHSEALKRDRPIIVELGVDKGQSTRVFLNAIDNKTNARLIKEGILSAVDKVIKYLNKVCVPVEDQIKEIATISTNNDKAIAMIPDFSNSALTFGPTFSTLLKEKS